MRASLEPLQQRGVKQVGLLQRGGAVAQLCAGEAGEQREGLQLVDGLGARHVRDQVAHRVRVVEAPRQPAAVRQSELKGNTARVVKKKIGCL